MMAVETFAPHFPVMAMMVKGRPRSLDLSDARRVRLPLRFSLRTPLRPCINRLMRSDMD
jgi:hypothetical protein